MKLVFTAILLPTSWLVTLVTSQALVDPLDIYRHYHVCDICPQEGEPTLESLGLPHETSNAKTLSCDEARALVEDGRYSPAACILLRLRLHEDCGCSLGKSLPAAAHATSTTPLEAKEHKRTPGEVVTATSTVLLAPVPEGSLEDVHVVAFEGAMETFLDARIQGLENLKCQITDQHVSSSKLVSAVEVAVSCQGESSSMSSQEFQELADNAAAENTPELLASLRENPNFINNVATILNFDDEIAVNTIEDFAEEKYVWIIAGAFGIGGVFILCVFMTIFAVKARKMRMLQKPSEHANKRAFYFGRKKSTRLSKLQVPVAAAAAIAALVRESTDPEVKELATKEEDATVAGDTVESMSTLRRNMSTRSVQAPSGKLGIVIDTTLEGPVIHTVRPTSPLFGLVFPGDIVISLNNEDTRSMSAVSLTDLMTRTSEVKRELVVLSQDVVG